MNTKGSSTSAHVSMQIFYRDIMSHKNYEIFYSVVIKLNQLLFYSLSTQTLTYALG